ncbi:MAG: ATP-binding protein [Planctomycetes bacterium]|nr:ATP-binding protein [Planctomycetota bacterium]
MNKGLDIGNITGVELFLHSLTNLLKARDSHSFVMRASESFKLLFQSIESVSFYTWDAGKGKFARFDNGAKSSVSVDSEAVDQALANVQVNFAKPIGAEQRGECTAIVVPIATAEEKLGYFLVFCTAAEQELSVTSISFLRELKDILVQIFLSIMKHEREEKSENILDNILESVPYSVVTVSKEGKVMNVNSNCEFMFNVVPLIALDSHFSEVFPEQVSKAMQDLSDKALLGAAEIDYEVEHNLEDGTNLHLGITASDITDIAGSTVGVLFLIRDLGLSREVTKLQELDKLKSEFVNTVSHELKTPLTAIIGGVEILKADIDQMTEDMIEVLEVIEGGAKRLQTLITDLLDLSKLETGSVRLQEDWFDVAKIVKDACAVQARSPLHTVKTVIEQGMPKVLLDGQKILQVFTNLISNAIKYSPSGGEVLVNVWTGGGELFFSVKDQGLGILKENQEKVFERFFRVDASMSSEIEGTGLGLAIVKLIVELHGGAIWIESEVGKGSEFIVRMPLTKQVEGA